MKDFAKSIVCNTKADVAKVGNSSGIKEFNTEADLRRWCIEHQYAYTPTHGGYYRLEDDKPGRNRPDLYAHVKAGNSKVENAVLSYEDKARIAKQRYLEAKSNKDYPEGVKYEERMAKDNINRLNEILQKIRTGKLDSRYEADEKDVEKAISIYKQIGNSKVGNAMDRYYTEYKKNYAMAGFGYWVVKDAKDPHKSLGMFNDGEKSKAEKLAKDLNEKGESNLARARKAMNKDDDKEGVLDDYGRLPF